MSYQEKRLKEMEIQFELAEKGFELVLKDLVYSEHKTNLLEKIEPYVDALKDLKDSVEYIRKEIEDERAKK
jgi:hypothetical protein